MTALTGPTSSSREDQARPIPTRPRYWARRRVALAAGAAIVVVVTAVVAWWFVVSSDDGGLADPNDVTLPAEPELPIAVNTYLAAEGAPLVELLRATAKFSSDDEQVDARSCRRLASDALPRIGDPPTLLALAARIPDPPTAQMAAAHLDATIRFLDSCVDGESSNEHEDLIFARTVLVRRLDQLGITIRAAQ